MDKRWYNMYGPIPFIHPFLFILFQIPAWAI
jgi:hypothetical protein